MKKIKLLTPLITVAALSSTIVPLTTITGCSDEKRDRNVSLMEEYTPTIGQRARESFASPNKAIDAYLSAVEITPEIFTQDLHYSLSRGLPEYMSYVSKFCEVVEYNFGMDIDPATVKVNKDAKTITFDLTMDAMFDYSGTKYEEMIWYELPMYRWDAVTKIRFVFDFNNACFNEFAPLGLRHQMTTIAGATQFGISELNSTAQLLSQTGYYLDLNHIKHSADVSEEEPTEPNYFILPSETYWKSEDAKDNEEEYYRRYDIVSQIWYYQFGVQSAVLMLKYYMGSSMFDVDKTPGYLDFGSYYMGNATLDDTYAFADLEEGGSGEPNTCSLYGFNLSLDSINNTKNIQEKGMNVGYDANTRTLTLPSQFNDYYVTTIERNAFNASISTYTNIGLPLCVEHLEIPLTTEYVLQNAFSNNFTLTSIKFNHDQSAGSVYPYISSYAFEKLTKVKTIDFSEYKVDEISTILERFRDGCFRSIHLGVLEKEDVYGTIIVPTGALSSGYANQWNQIAQKMGLPTYKSGVTPGWNIVEA